jgi:hypothetical protein
LWIKLLHKMANELNIVLADTGQAVTCQPYRNGAAVGSPIALSEIGVGSGVYTGNMAGVAGSYVLAFRAGGLNVGAGAILWDGAQEVTIEPIKAKTDALLTDRLAVCSTVEITGQQIANSI